MAKPPIETEGPFFRAASCVALVRRLLAGTACAVPVLITIGAVGRHFGVF